MKRVSLIKSYIYLYMFVFYFHHGYDYDYCQEEQRNIQSPLSSLWGAKGSLPGLEHVVVGRVINKFKFK